MLKQTELGIKWCSYSKSALSSTCHSLVGVYASGSIVLFIFFFTELCCYKFLLVLLTW